MSAPLRPTPAANRVLPAPLPPVAGPTRAGDDVSRLPDVAFGPADLMWWGTLGFVLIEGFTLVLCAAVLVYLRQNFHTWPPERTRLPSLGIPTVQVAVMLAALPAVWAMRRAARRFDLDATRLWTAVATLFAAAFVALRMLELTRSINVKFDANAYGSAQWLVLGSHGTLLLFELVEIAGMLVVFLAGRVEEKHFSDVDDAGFYFYFMILAWLPLYALCYWLPRWVV